MGKLSGPLDAENTPRARFVALHAVALVPAVMLAACAISRRWMDDDAFINLRVVRHVLEGHGPVFNIGDRVEVYTSALWLLILTLLGAIGVRLEIAAVWAGIVFSVLGLLLAQLACLSVTRDDGTSPRRAERIPLPLGALVVASIPVMWDYASGGLETGLTFLWLGASFFAVVRVADRRPDAMRPWIVAAIVAGLGPLVRPELALYAAGFIASMISALRPEPPEERPEAPEAPEAPELRRRATRMILAALAIPLAYQIFRMGYFAALTPNTAIAKEAFRWNWRQGTCYAKNFFGLYKLTPPLVALGLLWFLRARALSDRTDRIASAMTTPVFIASLHGFYVVLMGGDYMHGRMFLPCVFAASMPVAMVAIRPPDAADRRGFVIRAVAALVIVVWAPICAGFLRVDRENVCYIGDERGWYARVAKVDNPVLLDDYEAHHFYREATNLLERVRRSCPEGADPTSAGCRVVQIGEAPEYGLLSRGTFTMADAIDARIVGVVGATAVGIVGYYLPSNVYLADHHGLGDPIGSRIALGPRGRPGHEKQLSNAWIVARLSKVDGPEDGLVRDARAALACAPLADLDRATRAPLTAGRFFSNLTSAFTFQRLRVPSDATDAAEKLCGIRPPPKITAGGAGGYPYRWTCPERMTLGGIGISLADATAEVTEPGLASIEAHCRGERGATIGPPVGTKSGRAFDIVCPPGAVVIGLHGHADTVVRDVGAICSPPSRAADPESTPAVGRPAGDPFRIVCQAPMVAVGIAGAKGALVDAVGVQCATP
ncbi:MAG: hypothetical protein KF819_19135 [Labilithrix sp.]|nr:hypothetical protein [Labilithrix sp.]